MRPPSGTTSRRKRPSSDVERPRRTYYERLEEAYEEGRGGGYEGPPASTAAIRATAMGREWVRGRPRLRPEFWRVWLPHPALRRSGQGLPSPLVKVLPAPHELRPRRSTRVWSAGTIVLPREVPLRPGTLARASRNRARRTAGGTAPESPRRIPGSPPKGPHALSRRPVPAGADHVLPGLRGACGFIPSSSMNRGACLPDPPTAPSSKEMWNQRERNGQRLSFLGIENKKNGFR